MTGFSTTGYMDLLLKISNFFLGGCVKVKSGTSGCSV